MIVKGIFSSESVTEGHPDKICDKISDSILDEAIKIDPSSKVACETLIGKDFVVLTGEISYDSPQILPYENIIRQCLKNIGYVNKSLGIDYKDCAIIEKMNIQSPDIHRAVFKADNSIGAGDQGMMFGFATDESDTYMPLSIALAHKLTHQYSEFRKSQEHQLLGPDGKAQVSVYYDQGKPSFISTVLMSVQHTSEINQKDLKQLVLENVIKPSIDEKWISKDTKFIINPGGDFIIGGPESDTGLTGRKIIVDTYGGAGRHGGGAFSGKDATKVDRSAAYMARYIAKNIVVAGLAKMCEIQLAYAFSQPEPVSIYINTFGTGKISDDKIEQLILDHFSFTPKEIIEKLDLRQPIFTPTSCYGHFGRNPYKKDNLSFFTWEEENQVDIFRSY